MTMLVTLRRKAYGYLTEIVIKIKKQKAQKMCDETRTYI